MDARIATAFSIPARIIAWRSPEPYLPRADVETTSAASYVALMAWATQ